MSVPQPILRPHVEQLHLRPPAAIVDAFNAGAAQIVFLPLSIFDEALAEPILASDELERARRLVAPVVRRGFVGGRFLLRSVLAALADAESFSLELQAGFHGKPSLVGHERLSASFNLSHSGDLVALALIRARRVGIDIEADRALTDAALLARRILSRSERARFESLPENARGSALLAAWTRKEAVLKAIGTGVSGGLNTVEVLADCVVTADETPAIWSVRTLPMPTGFFGAIALEGDPAPIETWQAVPQVDRSA